MIDPLQAILLTGTEPSVQVPVEIVAKLGGVESVGTLMVTVNNPCMNPQYMRVFAVEIPNINYTVYQVFTWTHPLFTAPSSAIIQQVCGPILYTIDAGPLTQYIHYVPG